MLVKNNTLSIHNLAGKLVLIPGINKVDSKAWAEAMKVELLRRRAGKTEGDDGPPILTEDGKPEFEVIADDQNGGSKKVGQKVKGAMTPTGAEVPGDQPGNELDGMTVPEATKIIGETFDRDLLESWDQAESEGKGRAGVHDAIEKQLAAIDAKGEQ